MNIQLRDYQENLKNKTRKAFLNNKRIIMLAPCRKWQNNNFKFYIK